MTSRIQPKFFVIYVFVAKLFEYFMSILWYNTVLQFLNLVTHA